MSTDHQLVDPTFDEVQAAVDRADRPRAIRAAYQTAATEAARVFGPIARDRVLDAQAATPLLSELHDRLVAIVQARAGTYSRYRWLWLARRLPSALFRGSLASTAPYDRALFETSMVLGGANFNDANVDSEANATSFVISDSGIRHTLSALAVVRIVSGLQVCLRWAGKGAPVRIAPGRLPESLPDAATRQAVELYDRRQDKDDEPFTRLGTVVAPNVGNRQFMVAALGLMDPPEQVTLEGITPLGVRVSYSVNARYSRSVLHLTDVLHLLADPALADVRPWTDLNGALVVLLRAALQKLLYGTPEQQASLLLTGYFASLPRGFAELVASVGPEVERALRILGIPLAVPTSVDDLLTAVHTAGASIWPLRPGPVMIETPLGLVIDVANVFQRLHIELEYPRLTGSVANVRAGHFEEATQRIIDSSLWAPSTRLRTLRGRELRLNGRKITDLDAIGERGSTLLLVSCKSVPYSAEYDRGDFRAVRNAASTVVSAVEEWQERIETLRANPRGDNYDLSGYQLAGVVCTPGVVYVPCGSATAPAVGNSLAASVSARELAAWLHT